jgi:hypothetical protein
VTSARYGSLKPPACLCVSVTLASRIINAITRDHTAPQAIPDTKFRVRLLDGFVRYLLVKRNVVEDAKESIMNRRLLSALCFVMLAANAMGEEPVTKTLFSVPPQPQGTYYLSPFPKLSARCSFPNRWNYRWIGVDVRLELTAPPGFAVYASVTCQIRSVKICQPNSSLYSSVFSP